MTTANLRAIRKHRERDINTSAAIRHAIAYLSDCEPDRPHSGECSSRCRSPLCDQWRRWTLTVVILKEAIESKEAKP